MKLYDIIAQAAPLLETNEDLFPGIASSVFDDVRAKDQTQPDSKDINDLKQKRSVLNDRINAYIQKISWIKKQLAAHDALTAPSVRPDEVPYTAFPWLDNYSDAKYELSHVSINKKSPWFDNIEDKVAQLDNTVKQKENLYAKKYKITDQIKEIEASQRKTRRGSASSAFDKLAKTAPKLSPPSVIPNKLPIKNRGSINNPYVIGNAINRYVGDVFHFPGWSPYWKDQIMQIEDILERNGKGGLGMMYSSTHNNNGARFNFVITGANGNLTWRKYDPSPGAGANWIYLNGKKMNTSALLKADKAQQDQAVQAL